MSRPQPGGVVMAQAVKAPLVLQATHSGGNHSDALGCEKAGDASRQPPEPIHARITIGHRKISEIIAARRR
jgi:hypothetical protein